MLQCFIIKAFKMICVSFYSHPRFPTGCLWQQVHHHCENGQDPLQKGPCCEWSVRDPQRPSPCSALRVHIQCVEPPMDTWPPAGGGEMLDRELREKHSALATFAKDNLDAKAILCTRQFTNVFPLPFAFSMYVRLINLWQSHCAAIQNNLCSITEQVVMHNL